MKSLKYTVINNPNQYNEYCNILESLVTSETESNDEIELLSLLIDDYNDRVMKAYDIELNPVELLTDLLEENRITQKELSRRINISPQLINDVLKYRREITKKLSIKLSNEFKINFAAFLKPYRLKRAS